MRHLENGNKRKYWNVKYPILDPSIFGTAESEARDRQKNSASHTSENKQFSSAQFYSFIKPSKTIDEKYWAESSQKID